MFTVLTFGYGEDGELGLAWDKPKVEGPHRNALMTNVVAICIRSMHGLALTREGRIYSCGVNDNHALGRDIAVREPQNSHT